MIDTASSFDKTASGTFEVQMKPLGEPAVHPGATLGHMALDKQFSGDLVATGKGQMLTAMAQVKGSAGYVAIERVTGTLHGRRGSFVLQHSGVMDSGQQQLSITVVPDSGTEDLTGLAGRLTIDVSSGQHAYVLAYTLPA